MGEESLLVDLGEGRLRLTINRPEKRNALTMSLLDRIGETLRQMAGDQSIRVAVICASGERAFAAGGDLRELDAVRSVEDTRAMAERGRAALDAIRGFPVPVIAALNGVALGGGAELAIACDLRVAARHAEIGFIQSRLQLTTAWGGGIDLMATVGRSHALRLLTRGERVAAEEALSLGLINACCSPGQGLESLLDEFISPMLANTRPVQEGIKSVAAASRAHLHGELAGTALDQFVRTWTHDDHWHAVEAAMSGKS